MSEFGPSYNPEQPEYSSELGPQNIPEDSEAIGGFTPEEEETVTVTTPTEIVEPENPVVVDDELRTRLAKEGIYEKSYIERQYFLRNYAQKVTSRVYRAGSSLYAPEVLVISEGKPYWVVDINSYQDPEFKSPKAKLIKYVQVRNVEGETINLKPPKIAADSPRGAIDELPDEATKRQAEGKEWQIGAMVKAIGIEYVGKIQGFFPDPDSPTLLVMFRDYTGRPNLYEVPYIALELIETSTQI